MEGDILQYIVFAIGVHERDVLEDQVASRGTRRLDAAIEERFAVLFDDLHQAAVRDQSRRSLHDDASQVADRPDQLDDQAHVCEVGANRDGSLNGKVRGIDETEQHLEAKHNIRERPEHRVHDEQSSAAAEFFAVILLELLHLVVLAGEGLHHAHAGQVLLQGRRKHGFLFLILFVTPGHEFEEPDRDGQNDGDGNHRKPGQFDIQVDQRHQVDDEHQQDASHADGLFAVEAAQGVHVRGDALDQIARRRLAVIRKGQALDMVEEIVAQAAGDSLGGVGGEASRKIGEQSFETGQSDEPERDDGQSPIEGAKGQGLRAQHGIGKVAEQKVGQCAREGRNRQGHGGGQVGKSVILHHAPHACQSLAGQRLAKVIGFVG